jgi:hypothetical protein
MKGWSLMAHFHNDTKLQAIVMSILAHSSAFIETGAFHGDTSKWIAEQNPALPVYTCEVNERFYNHARARMPSNATIRHASSPDFLDWLFNEGASLTHLTMPFFFLDAHWYDYWPLRDELKLITKVLPRSIVLIHDFKVPDRDNFSYCNGGGGSPEFSGRTTEGGPVPELEYILDVLEDGFTAYYPTYADRVPGYVLIFQNVTPFGDLRRLEVTPESQNPW